MLSEWEPKALRCVIGGEDLAYPRLLCVRRIDVLDVLGQELNQKELEENFAMMHEPNISCVFFW